MAERAEGYWWYRGLRDLLARCLTREDLAPRRAPAVLDVGCGTGENLALLRDLLAPSYLGGFDNAEHAVELARRRCPEADTYVADVCDPELRQEPLDVLLSMDVVYVPGVERAFRGMQRLTAALRPGGLWILNLPAYDWLYSEHDVAVHTHERYTIGRVNALLRRLGLTIERSSYRLCLLFPAVVARRLPGILGRRREGRHARSDLDGAPGATLNRALTGVLSLENRLIARGARLPWGSSVFAVGRKPG